MKQKPEESIRIFAAGLLLKQLDILNAELAQVRKPRDIESVHRTRVSSRRLRAILDIFNDCLPAKRGEVWQQSIRKLTGALGAARDTDVQIASVVETIKAFPEPQLRPGLRRLLLRLRQRRARLQTRLITRLDDFEATGIMEEMRAASLDFSTRNMSVYLYTPELYRRSFNKIQAAYKDFVSYEDKIKDENNVADLHAMRIAGKNLRYVMECFSLLYSTELKNPLTQMRVAQDLLGIIHDCDVWIQTLPGFMEGEREKAIAYYGHDRNTQRLSAGINYFLELKQQERRAKYQSFLLKWDQWKEEKLWESLFQTLQVPFFNQKEIMPLSLIEQVRNGGTQ